MTEPLTPPGCDMSGNDWFPFHFARLRKSKWWRRASDLARARNVMLWGEAYAAVPAGSLPDDDDELAEAAGFGFDVESFLAAKDEIMGPWVLCSDGRWYHPTVCEVVVDAWSRVSETRKKEAGRKAEQRAKLRSREPSVPPKLSDVPWDNPEIGRDISHRQTDTTDRTENPPTPQGDERDKDLFQEAYDAYPEAGRASTSPEKAANGWLTACLGAGGQRPMLGAVRAYAASPAAKLDGGKRVPSMHRWLAERRYEAFLVKPTSGPTTWTGPPDIRRSVVAMRGEDFAASYLDQARWQEVPVKAVIGRTSIAADKLKREAGSVFSDAAIEILEPSAASERATA